MNKITRILPLISIVFLISFTACVDTKFPASTDNQIVFNDTLTYDTLIDVDGNAYHAIQIGDQTWMASNLKVTKYRNGDLIPTTSASKNINSKDEPKYQWAYKGDEKNVMKYGRLYTWYAITDARNIAPEGWHVATAADWKILEDYVAENPGTSQLLVKALAGTTDWKTDETFDAIGNNLSINNFTGFTALPGGRRYPDGTCNGLEQFGYFWTDLASDSENAHYRILGYCNSQMYKNTISKKYGFSVRCVKDN